MEIIADFGYCKLEFHPELKVMKVIWNGIVTSEQYRNVFLTALTFAEKNTGMDTFMSDIRNQGVISPNDRKWFQEFAVPSAMKLGLKKACVVFSGNVFARYYINNISGITKRMGLPMQFFTSEEDAINWIKSFMGK